MRILFAFLCLTFGLTTPLASAEEALIVGAQVGSFEVCYELLGPGIIQGGCEAPCVIEPLQFCNSFHLQKDIATQLLA